MQGVTGEVDVMAMYSKGGTPRTMVCTICARTGNTNDRCWEKTGLYPPWHYKHKPGQKQMPNKWAGNRRFGAPKVANNAQGHVEDQQEVTMTAE